MHTWLLFPSPDSFRPHLLFTKFSASLFSCFSFPFILFLPSFSSFPTPFFSSSPLGFPTPVYFLFLCFLLSYFFYIPMFPLVTIVYFSFCFPLLFPNALVFLSSPSFNFVISHFLFFFLFTLPCLLPYSPFFSPSPTLLVSSTQLFSSTCLLHSSSSHFLLWCFLLSYPSFFFSPLIFLVISFIVSLSFPNFPFLYACLLLIFSPILHSFTLLLFIFLPFPVFPSSLPFLLTSLTFSSYFCSYPLISSTHLVLQLLCILSHL